MIDNQFLIFVISGMPKLSACVNVGNINLYLEYIFLVVPKKKLHDKLRVACVAEALKIKTDIDQH